jgi:hypothetical protein
MMRRDIKVKCFLIAVCGICLFATAGATKPDSINVNSLEGVWVLDSIELYKYSDNDNDSVKVSNDLLPENNVISGVFDTIRFDGNKCSIRLNNYQMESTYVKDGNNIKLYLTAVPFEYTIYVKNERLILYRKYYYSDNENPINNVLYNVNLTYSK